MGSDDILTSADGGRHAIGTLLSFAMTHALSLLQQLLNFEVIPPPKFKQVTTSQDLSSKLNAEHTNEEQVTCPAFMQAML